MEKKFEEVYVRSEEETELHLVEYYGWRKGSMPVPGEFIGYLKKLTLPVVTEEEITEQLENLWDELHWSCGEDIDDLQQVAGNRLLLDSEFQRELLPRFRAAIKELLTKTK